MNYEILALITARGGSKSIPQKNIRLFLGNPLIAYTIKELKKSRYISRAIVSTDSDQIANISKDLGVEVPFLRPKELAEDFVQDFPVVRHALEWLSEKEGYAPDIIVHLRPTAPLRKSKHIDEAIEVLIQHPEADSVRSVYLAPRHPLKMWKIENEELVPFIPANVYKIKEAYNYPRQKLPAAYVQNGSVDVIWAKTIIKKNSMSGDKIMPYVMDESDSVNVDTLVDFKLAEMIMKEKMRK